MLFEDIFIKSKGVFRRQHLQTKLIKAAKSHKNSTDEDRHGVKTGFTSLDAQNRVYAMPQELIILAAGPGEGKTTYAFNIAKACCPELKAVFLFFSLEMSKHEMALKVSCPPKPSNP
jgi:replicative DNA helicase